MLCSHSSQVMTRGRSPGTTHPRLLPILMTGDCDSFLVGGLETARAGQGNASGSGQR